MTVVIAGCGWLGIELGRALLERGHRVVGVRRSPAAAARLAAAGIEPLIRDLADPHTAGALPSGIEAVVACQSASSRSEDGYREAYVAVNRSLAELAATRGIGRLVYTGSTGVFGQTDGCSVDETTTPRLRGSRGRVLGEAETLVWSAAERGVRPTVVRLSGLYGPGRLGIVDRVRDGRLALGPGDGRWMNFCHRDDAVRTLTAVLEHDAPGRLYHASDANPTRRRDVVAWIAHRLGIPTPRRAEAPEGEAPDRRVLADRTRSELCLELLYPSYREGLAEALSRS